LIDEARLERVESGLTPVTAGWFVLNARDGAWLNNDATEACCIFESDDFVLRGRPDLIITALANRKDPKRWKP
jgi:hypothetical protein